MAETIFYIYSITNQVNGKRYIGSTVSTTEKWKTHRWQLNKGTHDNPYLQRAWRKHGKCSFIFDIIETSFGGREDKQKLEDFYMDKFHSRDRKFGYNINTANLVNNTLSEETKKKISDSMINNAKISKKIIQYDIFTGKFIKEWASSMEIKRVLGGSNGGYLKCCKHDSSFKSVKGFGWAFPEEYFSKKELEWATPNYIPHFKILGNKRSIMGKNIITGEIVCFDTITNGAKSVGCSTKHLQRAVQFSGTRGRKTCRGYSWSYSDITN